VSGLTDEKAQGEEKGESLIFKAGKRKAFVLNKLISRARKLQRPRWSLKRDGLLLSVMCSLVNEVTVGSWVCYR